VGWPVLSYHPYVHRWRYHVRQEGSEDEVVLRPFFRGWFGSPCHWLNYSKCGCIVCWVSCHVNCRVAILCRHVAIKCWEGPGSDPPWAGLWRLWTPPTDFLVVSSTCIDSEDSQNVMVVYLRIIKKRNHPSTMRQAGIHGHTDWRW